MAEIKIEKKKSYWPWILIILLLLVGIIYLYYSMTNVSDKYSNDSTNTEIAAPVEEPSAVNNFIEYVNSDTNKMGLDHTFTNAALLKLRQAIEAMADKTGYDVKADLEQASNYADKITNDPFETSHANSIRKSADIFSTSLVNMQKSKYPALTTEAIDVTNASSAIDPEVLTLDQKEKIKSFFQKAADLLSKMK